MSLEHLVSRLPVAGPVARERRGPKLRERRVRGLALGLRALVRVLGSEDLPVAVDERRRLGERRSVVALRLVVGLVDEVLQAGLVGVEQVLLDRERRLPGLDLSGLERVDRRGRVDSRAGEPRRLAEVADEDPVASRRDVAVAHGCERHRVGAAADRGDDVATRGGELGLVAGPHRPLGAVEVGEGVAQRPRVVAAQAVGQRAAEGAARLVDGVRVRRLVQDQVGLWLEQRLAYRLRRLPRRRLAVLRFLVLGARGGGEREAGEQGGRRCREGTRATLSPHPAHNYACNSTPRRLAAWVTWPAIASAWRWASEPSVSACSP